MDGAHKSDIQIDIDVCASRLWQAWLNHAVRYGSQVIRGLDLTTGVATSG